MQEETLKELDYFKIRSDISNFCVSVEGKNCLQNRLPFTDFSQIEFLKNISKDWASYISLGKNNFLHWDEIESVLKVIKISGSTISLEQLRSLQIFCTSVSQIKLSVQSANEEQPLSKLFELTESIPVQDEVLKIIQKVLNAKGELRDLPELRKIKNKIAELSKLLQKVLYSYTQDASFANFLESSVPVLRGEKQVLAVKVSHKNKIKGIVHGFSGSGQTVYIEPLDAVQASNDLVQETYNLEIALREILNNLTKELHPFAEMLETSLSKMITLDVTRAASLWGVEHKANYARTVFDGSTLILKKARHPLLGKDAIPLDVSFAENTRVLIITGPNTGGKTVALKTIALFSLLNQSAFPLPAYEGCVLPIFSKIFADIGDGQSLDQSLSTFSAHMKKIAEALKNANESTLVLLDELGSGTDPQEGSAIAMSILDELIKRKAFVLVTTHHGAIKNYGWTNLSCMNASVEFNQETLSPTYRLIMGVPGESRAFDIAEKSGIPRAIIEGAKNYVKGKHTDISLLIKTLNEKNIKADELLQQCKVKENELNEKQMMLESVQLKNREKELELKTSAHTMAEEFLSESRKQLENLVRVLREGEITKEKTKAVKNFIFETTEKLQRESLALEKEKEILEGDVLISKQTNHPKSKKPSKKRMKNALALQFAESSSSCASGFTNDSKANTLVTVSGKTAPVLKTPTFGVGSSVVAKIGKNRGVIISSAGKNKWLVQFGSLQIQMAQKDLELLLDEHSPVSVSTEYVLSEKPSFELRLLGAREVEALEKVEHQLYLCAVHGFKQFSIIHGKGDGVLQKAIHKFLGSNKSVKSFHFARPEDGGTGKTYVMLE